MFNGFTGSESETKNYLIMKKLCLILAVAGMMCSCASTVKTRSSRTAKLPANISLSPSTTDLKVAETKSYGSYEALRKNGKPKFISKSAGQREACADALAKSGADVLINPSYTYTYKGKNPVMSKLIKVEVTGYAATYGGFRSTTLEDAAVISKLREPAAVIIKTIEPANEK